MGRVANWAFGLRMLPKLAANAGQRHLLGQMRALVRRLPTLVKQPMPVYMVQLGNKEVQSFSTKTVRNLADLAALLERRLPLGICLRRSLVRYHYLNKLTPLAVQFGARFDIKATKRSIAGHAWVTHASEPYFEDDEN